MCAAKTIADGHCHLADRRIASEIYEIVSRAKGRGIGLFVQGGVDPEDWERQIDLKKRYPKQIITSFGLHPWWVASHSQTEFDEAFKLLSRHLVDADGLGEIGLDHGPKVSKESYKRQEHGFRAQLDLFRKEKPLILHIVRAHGPALEGLARKKELSGMLHSFSGSREIAKKYLDLDLYLSISPAITRKGFETLKRCVSYIPLDRLILESDSPDQKPVLWEKAWNEPTSLFETATEIAGLRKTSAEALLEASTANVKKLFRSVG